MKKINCIFCDKYRKFKNPKTSYLFDKPSTFSIICSKCDNEDKKKLKRTIN